MASDWHAALLPTKQTPGLKILSTSMDFNKDFLDNPGTSTTYLLGRQIPNPYRPLQKEMITQMGYHVNHVSSVFPMRFMTLGNRDQWGGSIWATFYSVVNRIGLCNDHDDVLTCKRFPHYNHFMMVNYQSPVVSPHQCCGTVMFNFFGKVK